MKKLLIILTMLTATSVKAESIEQWCKNGRDGEKYIGASIGALACVAAFPVGCVAIPVGYLVPQLTDSDVKGCVKNRKKELGVK